MRILELFFGSRVLVVMSESSLRLGLEKELRLRRSRRVIIIDDERETVSCDLLSNVSPSVTDFSESS